MKKEDSKILDKLGKNPGFKTPDNFFEDFGKNLMDKLPEETITEEQEEVKKPTMWLRLRPYVYAAAMVAGIACMMTIFTHMTSGTQPEGMAEGPTGGMGGTVITTPSGSDTSVTNYEDSVRNASFEIIK